MLFFIRRKCLKVTAGKLMLIRDFQSEPTQTKQNPIISFKLGRLILSLLNYASVSVLPCGTLGQLMHSKCIWWEYVCVCVCKCINVCISYPWCCIGGRGVNECHHHHTGCPPFPTLRNHNNMFGQGEILQTCLVADEGQQQEDHPTLDNLLQYVHLIEKQMLEIDEVA